MQPESVSMMFPDDNQPITVRELADQYLRLGTAEDVLRKAMETASAPPTPKPSRKIARRLSALVGSHNGGDR